MRTMNDLLHELDVCGITYELKDSPLSGDKNKYVTVNFRGVDVGVDFADLEGECFSNWQKDGQPIYTTSISNDCMESVFRELTEPVNYMGRCLESSKRAQARAKAKKTRCEKKDDYYGAMSADREIARCERNKNLCMKVVNSFN